MTRKALLFGAIVLTLTLLAPTVSAQTDTDESVDTVILASTANYPDAFVASAAAAKLEVPVLLTDSDELPDETRSALEDMSPSEVILVGGESVITGQIEQGLTSDGYETTRLWGNTRYGTAVEVAEHFWTEGADEAVLIQNSLGDDNGDVVGAAKELARDDDAPVYLTPEDGVPAVVASSLENLDVEEVTIIGTQVSEDYRSDVTELGIEIDDEITGQDEDDVKDKIRDKVSARFNASEQMMVVASSGFEHSIAASHFPSHHIFHVGSEDDISDAVDVATEHDVSQIKVAGEPDLASSAAETLEAETDAEVNHVTADAETAVSMNAQMAENERPQFAERHRKAKQQWEERMQEHEERLKERVNKTINKAESMIDENSSEEVQDLVDEARVLYSDGDYQEARKKAHRAINAERSARWEREDERDEAIMEAIEEEQESLNERVEDLREMNREFAEEMEENMSVEERLDVIEEFRHEHRETVREMVEEARENAMDRREGLLDELRDARERVRDRKTGERLRFEAECTDKSTDGAAVTENAITGHDGHVRADGTMLLPTPNYDADGSFDRGDRTIDLTVDLTERGGFGVQCVAEADYRYRVDAEPGNWTVSLTVNVDGEQVYSDENTVTVTADEDDDETGDEEDEGENDETDEAQGEVDLSLSSESIQVNETLEFTVTAEDGPITLPNGAPYTIERNVDGEWEQAEQHTSTMALVQLEEGDTRLWTFTPETDGVEGVGDQTGEYRVTVETQHDEETEEFDVVSGNDEDTSSTDDVSTEMSLRSTDSEFYRDGTAVDAVDVPANEEVTVTFEADEDDTYFAGVEYHSPHFETDTIQAGEQTTATFTAAEDFTIESYWPDEEVYKAEVAVNVE